MTESDLFQIVFSSNFEASLKKLLKKHYRKNNVGRENLINIIENIIRQLSIAPRVRPPIGHLEPFPKGMSVEGYELWKLEFKMPQLQGASREGRLIYLLNTQAQKVVVVWIYTHAEFEKRPDNSNLKILLKEIIYNNNDNNQINNQENE
ncbi:hypothetical protein JJD41_10355 [Oxynema sp. CENA135]|uniref:hypothetical protein n=1 Tax=Oxynema sp. CENA135 TaxID=984206 RepID=UPI00190CB912|nr:hypothetical protein [Oxynema sp. CENA135]MBK4730260.1 hypothetical protein [Oxynema sp. CENA135]